MPTSQLPPPLYALTYSPADGAGAEAFQLRIAAALPADDPRIVEPHWDAASAFDALAAYRDGAERTAAANNAASRCRVTEELREEARRYYTDAAYRESLPWTELPA
jgi:hypothetical protein